MKVTRKVKDILKEVVHSFKPKPIDLAVRFLEEELDAGFRTNEDITEIVRDLSNKDRSIFWAVFNMLDKKRSEQWYEASPTNRELILEGITSTDGNIHPFMQVLLKMVYDLRKKKK